MEALVEELFNGVSAALFPGLKSVTGRKK